MFKFNFLMQNTNKTVKKVHLPAINAPLKICLSIYIALIIIILIGIKAGLRLNISPSVAIGIYQTKDLPVTKNNYINLCVKSSVLLDVALKHSYLNSNWLCPTFNPAMMKRIGAAYGDVVTIKHDGVWINNQIEPNSAKVIQFNEFDNSQLINYQLKENEILLMSDNQKYGFDGRYYGVLKLSDFSKFEVVKPVWTFVRNDK